MMGLLGRILPARLVLRGLLGLDNWLYRATSDAAMRYEGGRHPKHRLTDYHAYFVGRIKPEDHVLDVGCGLGVVDHHIVTATGARVTGIDTSATSIAYARRHYQDPRLTFLEGDARELPVGEGFDVVVLSNVLEHLDARVEFLRVVQERIRPRAILIRVPMFERDWRVPLKRELGVDYFLDPTHRVEHTHDLFLQELAAAGLEVEDLTVRWGEMWASCRSPARRD